MINVHYYETRTDESVTTTLKVDKVNPELKTVFVDRVTLDKVNDKRTVVRFTLAEDQQFTRRHRALGSGSDR